jgi:hypothetical protein
VLAFLIAEFLDESGRGGLQVVVVDFPFCGPPEQPTDVVAR